MVVEDILDRISIDLNSTFSDRLRKLSLTHLDLLGILKDITVILVVRECVVAHGLQFAKELVHRFVLSTDHTILVISIGEDGAASTCAEAP